MILRGNPEPGSPEWIYGPEKGDRCTFCHGELHFPMVQWSPYRDDGKSIFICERCCTGEHGLNRDLTEMRVLSLLGRLGFHGVRPTRDTVFVPPEDVQH